MRRALVPLILILACATAHAQKSRTTSQALSGGGAAVGGVVVMVGFLAAPESKPINVPVMYTGLGLLMVTPSLGQLYSGQYLTIGMGVRALATGFAIYALETQTRLATCDTAMTSTDPKCEIFTENAYPLLGIAGIAFIGGVWWDALDAGDAADRWNAKHGFSVTPTVTPTAHGGISAGLSGTF